MLKFSKGTIVKQRGGKVKYEIGNIVQQGKLQMVELIPVTTGMSKAVDITYRTVENVNNNFIKPRGGK